jgi:hypothetical protein
MKVERSQKKKKRSFMDSVSILFILGIMLQAGKVARSSPDGAIEFLLRGP